MKALIFKEGVSQWAEDGENVTHVIIVPNNSPSLADIQKKYNEFHHKKLEEVAKRLERVRKGAPRLGIPVRTKDGHYSQNFLRRFDEEKRQKNFNFPSWIIKTYKGKLVNFETIY